MASVAYGSGGVYGFLWFATHNFGTNSFVVLAQNQSGYSYNTVSGFSSNTYTNAASTGFGPFSVGAWTSNSVWADSQANNGIYSTAYSGRLTPYFPLSSGFPYCITALGISGSSPTGFVYNFSSLGAVSSAVTRTVSAVALSANPTGVIRQSFPSYTGNTFLFPAGSGGIASYNFTSTNVATYTQIPLPSGATSLVCCAVSGNNLFVGGAGNSVFSQNALAACYSSGNPSLLATFSPASNYIQVWSGSTNIIGPFFNLVGQLTVTGMSSALAGTFTSNTGFVVVDSGSGTFTSYSYVGGSLTRQNQISGLSGLYNSVTFTGTSALVPQRSTSGLLAFTQTSTGFSFSGSGATSAVTGINIGPLIYGASGYLAVSFGTTGNLFTTINASGNLNVPTVIGTLSKVTTWNLDQYSNFIGAGSGYSYVFLATGANQPPLGAITTPLGITGVPSGAASYNFQYYTLIGNSIVVQDSWNTQNTISTYSFSSNNNWVLNTGSAFTYTSGVLNPTRLFWYNGSLLVPTTSGILSLTMISPFNLGPTNAGIVGVYNLATSSYGSNISGLAQNVIPCSIGIDASGNVVYNNSNGSIFTLSSAAVLSGYQTIYSGGGGLVTLVPYTTGFYGAAALAPAVVGFAA